MTTSVPGFNERIVLAKFDDEIDDFLSESEWIRIFNSLKLSRREREICRFILVGLGEHEIARRLSISTHTVHAHMERLYRKLNVHSRCTVVTALFRAYAAPNTEPATASITRGMLVRTRRSSG